MERTERAKGETVLAIIGLAMALGGILGGLAYADDTTEPFDWATFAIVCGPFLIAGCVLVAASYIISAIAARRR